MNIRTQHTLCSLLLLAGILLTSCQNYHYDNALLQQVEAEGREKTLAWFDQHMPQAADVSVEVAYFHTWNDIGNITTGTFTLDSTTYTFHLNYETGECLTTQHLADFNAILADVAREQSVADSIMQRYLFDLRTPMLVSHYTLTCPLRGETFSNQNQFPTTVHYDSVRRAPITVDYYELPWDASDSYLHHLADSIIRTLPE